MEEETTVFVNIEEHLSIPSSPQRKKELLDEDEQLSNSDADEAEAGVEDVEKDSTSEAKDEMKDG